ncbi:MAG: glutamate--tRNA ligase [Acidaminococcales bacterium]|jgi:nondiscriminating glutamyl-tRNA synthetase|nr:glutamate--tRNA ligase [Acidaminococcales bacterium]
MEGKQVRVRFAPSPTGPLHIGGARSALFNWLLAKKTGGKFILRIEDTDLERSSAESEEGIKDALRWLGLTWDEGIDAGGEYAPYRQTERIKVYEEYTRKLVGSGQAYHCFCSDEELNQERQAALVKGQAPKYSGKCRRLDAARRDLYEKEGRKPAVRFLVPPDQTIVIDDLVRGEVVFDSNGIGDFIIVKSDGIPTYNYAVAIDDALMAITHVIRGEEHLSNTPRQALVYRGLGFTPPKFAHISLILGKDRSKMSKRHGATSVELYRRQGYLREGLLNFLALLGWAPPAEREIFTAAELVEQFSLAHCAKSPAIFDPEKLNWINAQHIRKLSDEEFYALALPQLLGSGLLPNEETREKSWLLKVVATAREHVSYAAQVPEHIRLYFEDEFDFESEEAKAVLMEEDAGKVLSSFKLLVNAAKDLTPSGVQTVLKELVKSSGLPGKKVYMPVRVAITGRMHGPELTQIIPLLGRPALIKRVDYSLSKISAERAGGTE